MEDLSRAWSELPDLTQQQTVFLGEASNLSAALISLRATPLRGTPDSSTFQPTVAIRFTSLTATVPWLVISME